MIQTAQICSVLPPFADAVGEGALKLQHLLKENGIESLIITSADQEPRDGVLPIMKDWNLLSVIRGMWKIKKLGIRVVLLQYPSAYFGRKLFVTSIPFILRLLGLKPVTILHEYAAYSKIGKLRMLPLLLFSKRIITSDSVNLKSMSEVPFVKNKSTVITIGTNFFNHDFAAADETGKLASGGKISVLYFGYIMEGKGLPQLLDTFDSDETIRSRFDLHIVGTIPERPSKNNELLFERVKSAAFLTHHGYLPMPELQKMMRSADLIFLPFESGVTERRGSFMACMAFAKPVITTRPQIPIDGLIEKKNVFYLDSVGSDEIKSALFAITKYSGGELSRIGLNAQSWYMENYSDEIYITKIMQQLALLKDAGNR